MNAFLIKNILAEELFGNRLCESLEDRQIVNFMYKELLLEKLLFGEPISVPELRKLLRKSIVNFEFVKLDGEVRPAKGTTMMKYIPPKDHPKGIRPSSPKVATFFDLDKDAWRSVSKRSKEIVLKQDEKTKKPVVVVKDIDKVEKEKVKTRAAEKERISSDPIEQGKSYKFTTNRGNDTHVEILRELPNGMFQVASPLFTNSFAIDPSRIGDQISVEKPEVKDKVDIEDVDLKAKTEPKVDVDDVDLKTKKEPDADVEDVDLKTKKEEPDTDVVDVDLKTTSVTPPQKFSAPTSTAPPETVILLPTEIEPVGAKEKPAPIVPEEPPEEPEIGEEGPEEEEI